MPVPKYLNPNKIGRRIRCDVGRKLSQLGERWNKPTLIYNRFIFAHFHWLALQSAPTFVRIINNAFPNVKTMIDVGAGTGAYVAEFQKTGKKIIGIENSALARKTGQKMGADMRPFDLNDNPPAPIDGMTFDLAYSIEVAEHLPPAMGDTMVAYMSTLAPTIVFTAAQPPPRGGIGHINEQPRQYWIDRFVAKGYTYRDDITQPILATLTAECKEAWWLGQNLSVFTK